MSLFAGAPRLLRALALALAVGAVRPATAQIAVVAPVETGPLPSWRVEPAALANGLAFELSRLPNPSAGLSGAAIARALAVDARTLEQQQAAGALIGVLARPEGMTALRLALGDTAASRRVVASLEPFARAFQADPGARQALADTASAEPALARWKTAFDGYAFGASLEQPLVVVPSGPVEADKLRAARLKPSPRPWYQRLDRKKVEQTLAHGEISRVVPLAEYFRENGRTPGKTQEAYIVFFADGTKGLWKYREDAGPAEAEKGAYDLAQLVDEPRVPPTVIRELGGRRGSLQYWIDTPIDPAKMKAAAFFEKMPPRERCAVWAYQFVFGQWDRKPNNLVLDEALAAGIIDNSEIGRRQRARYGENPFLRMMDVKAGIPVDPGEDAERFPYESGQPVSLDGLSPAAAQEAMLARFGGLVDKQALKQARWFWLNNDKSAGRAHLRAVTWQGAIWLQVADPKWGYGPIQIPQFYESTLAGYRRLTFDSLRRILPPSFSAGHIRDFLDRRDQLLRVAEKQGILL